MHKQPEHDYRVAIWMDHHVAKLIRPISREEFEIEVMEADTHGMAHDHSAIDKTSHTHDKHHDGKNRETLKHFFSDLEKKITGYDTFVLFGPSTAKNEFEHQIRGNRSFTGKRVACFDAEHMSDAQLVEFAKKNLRAHMDIYRDEEIIK